MPQPYDIELDGAGYMIAPGTYRRANDGIPEGRTGRVVVKDFFGGQRQALQLVRDRSWDSEGVGPALFGQGVEPWPFTTSHGDGVLASVNKTSRASSAVAGGAAWLAYGRFLYKSIGLTASAWASFVVDEDFGAGAASRDLCAYGDGNLAVAFGSTLDVKLYDIAAGTASTLRAGRKADCLVSNSAHVFFGGQEGTIVRIDNGTNQDSRNLDSKPLRMALHAGKVAIATRAGSLWLMGGKWDTVASRWSADPEPLFTHGIYADDQDYIFLTSFGGKLYTWLQGQVMEFNPNAGNNRQGWRATGLDGRSCYGATVAANMLVVAIVSRDGVPQVWAWDGSGWWLMNAIPGSSVRCWPMFLAGAGNFDLISFRDGSATYDLYRMAYRDETYHNYNSTGVWKSSLLDAGERDKLKAWRKIGASFAAPLTRGNAASVDPVTVTLGCSIDGGQTVLASQSAVLSDPTVLIFDVEQALTSNQAVSRYLQLTVTWSSVSDWAPVLTGVWVEYELLDTPAKRRKWSFKIHARDATVQRDGTIASRTGRQLAADLWSDWSAGNTIAFKDLDFDATAVTYQVRVVGIAEETPKPSDAGLWGESVLALTLVEV